jgi:hypothetical protein
MSSNGSKVIGKRKLAACLVFTCGYILTSTLMLLAGKISGAEYIEGFSITSYVVIGFLGVNAIGADSEAWEEMKRACMVFLVLIMGCASMLDQTEDCTFDPGSGTEIPCSEVCEDPEGWCPEGDK